MTSLDISSVRDFNKSRLRKLLIDLFFFSTNSIGPLDANRIELGSNYEKLIDLTNKNLFKDFDGKEYYLLSKQAYERPKTYVYVKLLNTNKFIKKVGDYLIEFRIVKKRSPTFKKSTKIPVSKSKSEQKISKPKNELKRSKINSSIFKSRTAPKDQIKSTKLGLDKVKQLENKIRNNFTRKNYSEPKKVFKDIFVKQHNSSIISKTSNILFSIPANWNYCNNYELDLNKIANSSNLNLEIDVRLIEFLEVNSEKAKFGRLIKCVN